jgi:hypothetical protein
MSISLGASEIVAEVTGKGELVSMQLALDNPTEFDSVTELEDPPQEINKKIGSKRSSLAKTHKK